MIGLVVVSHSPRLAEAAVELAGIMVHGERPPLRIAAGTAGGFGTDAVAVAEAIDAVAALSSGVLVLPDLGSAVLSAGLALDLRSSDCPVVVSDGPFVEGISVGLVLAASGASLGEVAGEVSGALAAKRGAAGTPAVDSTPPPASADGAFEEVIRNPAGLHARPVAALVKAVGGFDAQLTVRNETAGTGPVSAGSMIGLLSLGAERGHRVAIEAHGPDAAPALDAVRALFAADFGE